FSSRRRHTRLVSDWSSDVCSSDLILIDRTNFVIDQTGRQPGHPYIVLIEVNSVAACSLRVDDPNRRALRQPRAQEFGRHLEFLRSEERRVGKEGSSRWARGWLEKN